MGFRYMIFAFIINLPLKKNRIMTAFEDSLRERFRFSLGNRGSWHSKTIHNDFMTLKIDEINDRVRIWRCDENGNAPTRKSFNSCVKIYDLLLRMQS